MLSRTVIGLVVALVLMTVVGFLVGFFIPRNLGQTNLEFDLGETVKLNWCKENPDLCPMMEFPTEGREAYLVRNLSGYGQPDNDRCCPTNPGFITFYGEHTDYQQQACFFPPIKGFPPQSAHIGSCSGVNQGGCGAANGICKQRTRLSQKLCRRNENKPVITWFEVDAYCSCSTA
ncbi:uncharacterized protein [Littorina saxatilis]|uniref:Uncharacterized protein n=1 Tax=Littorina saxatilis TaxID=31220 RepID=A0AAN9GHC9_9CAEN